MTDFAGCQHVRQSLGVYVLGAIDPAERAQVDAHLASCPDCREELAGLAGLPALLGHVPVAEAARITGFDDDERLAPGQGTPGTDGAGGTLTPLLARMAHRRRVSRWRSLAAAAAVVVVAAGAAIGAVGLTGSPSPKPVAGQWERVQATDPATLAHVVVRYEGKSWGTVMNASVTGIPAGTTCQFWVLGSHGRKWAAGGWTVTNPYEQASYPASSPIPESAVRGFEVTTGHTVLVHVAT
jgi:anti-sigma-K factor RskA